MTLPEFDAFMAGFTAFHCAPQADAVSDDEYVAALAEEMAAGRAQ